MPEPEYREIAVGDGTWRVRPGSIAEGMALYAAARLACAKTFEHRLHTFYLGELCPRCGQDGPSQSTVGEVKA